MDEPLEFGLKLSDRIEQLEAKLTSRASHEGFEAAALYSELGGLYYQDAIEAIEADERPNLLEAFKEVS